LQWVTKPFEVKHIRGLFEETTPLMHDIAYNLIVGAHLEVDKLVQQALAEGYSANDVLDDGLISGMAVVGIKFRDNIIFVPEVLVRGGRFDVVRARPTFEEDLALERLPDWLCAPDGGG